MRYVKWEKKKTISMIDKLIVNMLCKEGDIECEKTVKMRTAYMLIACIVAIILYIAYMFMKKK